MLAYRQFGEPPEYEGISESLLQLYRLRTAQCLIIGDIAKCLPYTLETLRFNATAELNRKDDNSRGLWIMTGVIVRVAVNMGYHRDPAQSPSIPTLQAEYRRRVWLSVVTMDDMASLRVGFGRSISAISSDTLEPRNVHDWEMSDEMTDLPTSRPFAEATPVTYMIVKGRLFRVLGRITEFNNSLCPISYDTVRDIDTSLHEAHQTIPLHMKIPGGMSDPNSLRKPSDLSNFQMEVMYHYGMLTLHRKFIAKARLDPQYEVSRDRCISSALTLLDHQYLLDSSWYKIAQTRQVLSLASLVLLLELEHRRTGSHANMMSTDSQHLLQALESSVALWGNAKSSCDEASRLYHILARMVSSCQNGISQHSSQTQAPEPRIEGPGLSQSLRQADGNFCLQNDISMMSDENDIDWVSIWNPMESRYVDHGTDYLGRVLYRRKFRRRSPILRSTWSVRPSTAHSRCTITIFPPASCPPNTRCAS